MKTLILFFCFAFNLLAATNLSHQTELTTDPIVYSGSLHNDKTNQDIRMRMFFLHQPKLGQSTPNTTVLGMLYFGEEGTHEYVSLYYDTIYTHQPTREIMMFKDDDARSRRLPTIRMQFSSDYKTASGQVISQTESVVGGFKLINGWDFGPGNYLTELGGIYDASSCDRIDGSSASFEEIEIIPSRQHQEKLAPEGMFGETNYIGNGLCSRNGHVSCLSYSSGSYNYIRGRLDLHQGSYDWVCNRITPNEISCQGAIIKTCVLKRKNLVLAPSYKPTRTIPFGIFQWQNTIPTHSSQNCERWEGDYRGTMVHRLNSRKQYVEIRLNAFPTGTTDGLNKCIVTGSAKLHFVINPDKNSTLNFPIINIEMNAANDSMIFHSDAYTDLALHITVDSQGNLQGSWYSRLFGYVGELNAKKGATGWDPLNSSEALYSFAGVFSKKETPQHELYLRAIEAGFDKSSHDPFVQLKVQGTMFLGEALTKPDVLVALDSFTLGSYDYFTNFFTMRGSNIYSGYVSADGLHVRGSSSKYLSVVQHDLATVFHFQREKGIVLPRRARPTTFVGD